MNETTKAGKLQTRQYLYLSYLFGKIIDVGAGNDPLQGDGHGSVTPFDRNIGDAQNLLDTIGHGEFDCLYSSHCLEHMEDAPKALRGWAGAVKKGGNLIIVVPEAVFYERLVHPSPFNSDHRAQFTIFAIPAEKRQCPAFYDYGAIRDMADDCDLAIMDCQLELEGYDWHLAGYQIDQTLSLGACSNLVYVFRKR